MSSTRRAHLAWFPLHLVTTVLALLTLIAFLGRLGWRLELTSHFRVQYFAALAVVAAIYALARRGRPLLFSAFFLAINLWLIVPLYLQPPAAQAAAAEAAAPPLRVLAFNVQYANPNPLAVADYIRASDADFVVLIELTPDWRHARQRIRADYPYSTSGYDYDRRETELFSRRPFVQRPLPPTIQGDRPIIAVESVWGGQPFTLIAAHPASPITRRAFESRNRQLADIATLAQAAPSDQPVLIVGDLNTTQWSPAFRDLERATGLRNARLGFGWQPTWLSFFLPLALPIDHLLASPDVTVLDFSRGPRLGSDHLPIVVDLALP